MDIQNKAMYKAFVAANPAMFVDFIRSFEKDHITEYVLNFECTQFPLGKTKKTLTFIANAYKIHRLNTNNTVAGENVISIIISSNNLAETAQWSVRAEKELTSLLGGKDVSIRTISSKTMNDGMGSGKNMDAFVSALTRLPEKDLPDVLLMCCHEKRVDRDFIELLEAAKNTLRMDYGKRFKFNLFIDEADKNISLVGKVLKKIKRNKLEERLNQVHFITATPDLAFWNTLKKCGIKRLTNFDFLERAPTISDEERAFAKECYQSILTQTFNGVDYLATDDPLDYIKYVMTETELIDEYNPTVLFVPGAREKVTHNAIRDHFLDKGYWVFYHNGDFKGFIRPDGLKLPVADLMNNSKWLPQNGEKYELRDLLVAWRKNYPTASLAITGKTTISRGITFNSKDKAGNSFNFTHMIFSSCHTKNLAEFVQLLGRACGHKKYCDTIQIIGYTAAFNNARAFVNHILELKDENVKELTKDNMLVDSVKKSIQIWPDLKLKSNKKKHDSPRIGEPKILIKNTPATKEEVMELLNKIYPKSRPKFNQKINADGKYECTIRGVTKVYTYNEIYKNRGAGLNTNSKYRIYVGYTNDGEETWCVTYDKSQFDINTSDDE